MYGMCDGNIIILTLKELTRAHSKNLFGQMPNGLNNNKQKSHNNNNNNWKKNTAILYYNNNIGGEAWKVSGEMFRMFVGWKYNLATLSFIPLNFNLISCLSTITRPPDTAMKSSVIYTINKTYTINIQLFMNVCVRVYLHMTAITVFHK